MLYNVSQLLMEPIGSTRRFELHEPLSGVLEGISAGQATGQIRLLRTHLGLLADGPVEVEVGASCDRCLADFVRISKFDFEEECYPTTDPATGHRMELPDVSEGVVHIDSSLMLDLSDVLRQYLLTSEPLKALCRLECCGLCAECGADLNTENCACDGPPIDPRWGALADLLSGDAK
jgi:uncharacterized protein